MRGHGAWSDAPYVRVVTSAGHVEHGSSDARVEHLNNTVGMEMSATPFPVGGERGFFFCIPVFMAVVYMPILSSLEEYSGNEDVSNSTSSQMKERLLFLLRSYFYGGSTPVLSSSEEYSGNDNVSNSTSSQMKGFFVFFFCIPIFMEVVRLFFRRQTESYM